MNDLIDDSSSDMEDGGDASSGPSISDAKATVKILQNFFATETEDKNVRYSFLIIDKKIDDMYLKCRCLQQKVIADFHTLKQRFPTCGTRTPGATRRACWGYAKSKLVMAETRKHKELKNYKISLPQVYTCYFITIPLE
ncbi:hypothetical protein AVEN_233794-1 [Araneus ventricosus]|uniref:Uncharacterized protein n=1 Tax=Araneus ventricosus TaxID=182803 RepID=A0A4Y2QP44_ARAVE|nr:hypothetical protein AVEN_233794-1 [Araneus ventricosus]